MASALKSPSTIYHLPSTTPLIVIVGETGSGKSALALQLARKFDGEIISADSWQVYRGFDIGSAKPSRAEQKITAHHLLDIVDASDGFNVAQYQKRAQGAITDIAKRGKLPIIVGGTGLYIDSVLFDYGFLPAVRPAERDRRNQQSIEELLVEAETNGISMDGVDIRNKRRIIRALESEGRRASSKPLRQNTLILGISVSRDSLRRRVTDRVEDMLNQGLENEVKRLSTKYGWETEPMKGIGYQQWQEYFQGTRNLEETKQSIIKATMDLAKRQRTWFKRNDSIQWISNTAQANKLATQFLKNLGSI